MISWDSFHDSLNWLLMQIFIVTYLNKISKIPFVHSFFCTCFNFKPLFIKWHHLRYRHFDDFIRNIIAYVIAFNSLWPYL